MDGGRVASSSAAPRGVWGLPGGAAAGPALGSVLAVAVGAGLFAVDLGPALIIGVVTGAVYSLMALGLVLVFKSSGVFNFAQGEFATLAIFALWLGLERGLPYGVAVVLALLAVLVLGLVAERLVVRPLLAAPRVTVLVASTGIALLAIGLELWIGKAEPRTVPLALREVDRLRIAGVAVADQQILVLVVVAALGAVLAYFFSRTDLGLAILGASQEPMAAELVGIDVRRLSGVTWAAAAALGGLAGVLAAPINGFFTPGFMTNGFLIPAFSAAVLGGMGSLPGAFVGGIVVGVVQAVAISWPVTGSIPGVGTLAVFVLLLGVLTLRPEGLLGRRTVVAR